MFTFLSIFLFNAIRIRSRGLESGLKPSIFWAALVYRLLRFCQQDENGLITNGCNTDLL